MNNFYFIQISFINAPRYSVDILSLFPNNNDSFSIRGSEILGIALLLDFDLKSQDVEVFGNRGNLVRILSPDWAFICIVRLNANTDIKIICFIIVMKKGFVSKTDINNSLNNMTDSIRC